MRAAYKFSLLDLAGTPAYELPKETAIFTDAAHVYGAAREEAAAGRGYACFITKDEMRRRGKKLLRDDSLAIRCDVRVEQVQAIAVTPQQMSGAMEMRTRAGIANRRRWMHIGLFSLSGVEKLKGQAVGRPISTLPLGGRGGR